VQERGRLSDHNFKGGGNPHFDAARINFGTSPNVFGNSPRAIRTLPKKISSFLDYDKVSKGLILRQFQKSGMEFTEFQKKCKAKFSSQLAGCHSCDLR
jgi:hypothetical protein